jgi:hypothetical protein
VKVRLQTPELAGHYRGSMGLAIATIVKEERVFGLYKGISSPLVRPQAKYYSVSLTRRSSRSR